jgi:CheY-like chemotaxis protein
MDRTRHRYLWCRSPQTPGASDGGEMEFAGRATPCADPQHRHPRPQPPAYLFFDMLDLAKIEAGKLDLVPTDIHFATFLQGIVGICRIRAEQKGLTSFAASPDLPVGIRADEKRLRQVLLNLLGNAIKYTVHGGVIFQVSASSQVSELRDVKRKTQNTKRKMQNTSTIRFAVSDTGVGISAHDLPRLFRPFEQVGDFRQRAEGTGLGLAIGQRLLQRMGSAIQVESQLDAGSTFWFNLSIPAVAAALEAKPLSDRLIIGYTGPRRTILVADDSAYNRAFLVDLLTPLGFTLVEAAVEQAAVEQARARRPDAILMDLLMPGMTGIAATQTIRQEASLRDVVVIATSASAFDTDRQQALLAVMPLCPSRSGWPSCWICWPPI